MDTLLCSRTVPTVGRNTGTALQDTDSHFNKHTHLKHIVTQHRLYTTDDYNSAPADMQHDIANIPESTDGGKFT